MRLHFGPLRLRLHGSKRWLDIVRRRYGAFVDDEPNDPAEPEIRVDYESERDGPSPRQLGESLLRSPELTARAGVWHLRAAGVSGHLADDHIQLRGPLATYPLDSALIALWSLGSAPPTCGPVAAIVHGALIADEPGGRGWLCTGPSGVGKSTLARLLPANALCDELVGLRLEESAEGAELAAYSLPFWHGRPGRVQLAGVHFLRHGTEHARRPLCAAEAFASLRSQVLWPSWHDAALDGAFRVAAELAELPCHVLDFRPEADVWQHVSGYGLEASAGCLPPVTQPPARGVSPS